MTDQNVTNQTPEPLPAPEPTATTQDKTGGKTYTEAELEQIVKDRLAREKAKADKAAEAAAAKAAAEEAAKQGEWQKLAQQREQEAAELKAKLDALEIAAKKRAIGARYNLPDELASRLIGTTDEELEADAKKVAELLPKNPKPAPGPLNPGQNAKQGETREEKMRRIYGNGADMFDPEAARKLGGGVYFSTNE